MNHTQIDDWLTEKGLKPLYEFTVLHPGWELDRYGWICGDQFLGGTLLLVLTNHGSPYIADIKELETMYDKLCAYSMQHETALRILTEQSAAAIPS